MASTVYSVEGAVWACLGASWLATRLSISRSPLEEAALIPAVVLAVASLICSTFSIARQATERLYFQLMFALWLALAYEITECLVSQPLADKYLGSQGLGWAIPVATAAVSLAFLTVQVLIAAAAVPEQPWEGIYWTDGLVALVSTFHACANHGTPQSLGFSVVVLWASLCIFLAVVFSMFVEPFLFTDRPALWGLSVHNIIQILNIFFKVVCACFALALAYTAGHSTWALPLVLVVPIAVSTLDLVFRLVFTDLGTEADSSDHDSAPSAPDQSKFQSEGPVREAPVEPHQSVVVRPRQPQTNPAAEPVVRPRPPPINPAVGPAVRPRPPPTNPAAAPGQSVAALIMTSKIAQDALLFQNTRPLVAKNKKTS